MFRTEDWMGFTNLTTLSRKAGVGLGLMRRLVLKELADNAADESERFEFGEDGNALWVRDYGPGIPGDAHAIAALFSVGRPLTTTKIIRRPSRGALGNGLRVVVGAVVSTDGLLVVETRGRRYELRPLDDGTTRVLSEEPSPITQGARVTAHVGDAIPRDEDRDTLAWARLVKLFSSQRYTGKTSAWWYDSDSFYELFRAASGRTVGEVVELFHGFGHAKGEKGAEVVAGGLTATDARQVDREAATRILAAMRRLAPPIPGKKIGKVGQIGDAYRKVEGVLVMRPGRAGGLNAEVPFIVEAWALPNDEGDYASGEDAILAYVNGTPITAPLSVWRGTKNKIGVRGCGLNHWIEGVSRRPFTLHLNVTSPYVPITSDGKAPDFKRYLVEITKATTAATRKLKVVEKKAANVGSMKDTVLYHLEDAIDEASDRGSMIFSQRQLYYAVRPYVLDNHDGAALSYTHFQAILTDYENENGELAERGMYRDPRGFLYHPHTGQEIPLGSVAVQQYERPEWTFNRLVYIEKKGLIATLRALRWPERHDCALVSSEGFASRAVRDVMDALGETDEEITIFCVHDADSAGTMIYQALQEGTKARGARRVKVVNLGLEPWEGVEMDLAEETFQAGKSRRPVARYVTEWDDGYNTDGTYSVPRDQRRAPDGDTWERWLQTHRIELNAMQSRAFVEWLDRKIAPYHTGKVVPPRCILEREARVAAAAALRKSTVARILAGHDVDGLVAAEMERVGAELAGYPLDEMVRQELERNPSRRWTDPLHEIVAGAAAGERPAT